MIQRIHVAVVAATVGCLATLLLVFILRWCYHRRDRNFVEPSSLTRMASLQAATDRLHHQHQPSVHHPFDQGSKNRGNYFVFRRGISGRPLFSWADHPYLAADAVENGWSRFAFTGYKTYVPSPSKRTGLLGLGVCGSASGDHGREETDAEISWEVCQGSVDFMQKIRLNPSLKRIHPNNPSLSVFSVIRTTLPLPGPPLGNYSFPQEAYFEITVLYAAGADDYEWNGRNREGEKIKLIQDNSNSKGNNIEMGVEGKERGKSESVMFSLGLTSRAFVPLTVPGSYAGSIGFNSNGSVFLDGKLHVLPSCCFQRPFSLPFK